MHSSFDMNSHIDEVGMTKTKYRIEKAARCVTDEYGKSTHIAGHTQYIGLASSEPSRCTCDEFKLRKQCSHLDKAITLICHWVSIAGTPQTTPGICPVCGGPTREITLSEEITVVH